MAPQGQPKMDTAHEDNEQVSEAQMAGGQASKALNAEGQESAVQVSSTTRKVIHCVADLYKDDGELDEFWCGVIEEAPDE